MKPLNNGHLRFLKNSSVMKRCPLLGGSLTKIVTLGTKHFVRYSRHVRYLACPLLGALRKKCPNTGFFLVCIFPHLDWIGRDTPYLSVFSLNAGKCGQEKTPYLDTFHAVEVSLYLQPDWSKQRGCFLNFSLL